MIYVLDLSSSTVPRAWFAFDAEDLQRKCATLDAQYERCIYWNEAQAVAAFEGHDPRIAKPTQWRARRALYDQLVALEVLADDC
jgi:hypothetical protein